MSDEKRHAVFEDVFDCCLNLIFSLGVYGGCRVIQNQNRRISQNGSSYGYPLSLAARKSYSAFANNPIISLRESSNEFIGLSQLGSLNELLFIDISFVETENNILL